MDSMRSLNTSLPGSTASKQSMHHDSPEQLLDAFKAAALSVTKLYKTSAASQTKARLDGYQDCLDDLLAFLDKENIGVDDGEGWRIRQWATERLDNRDSPPHAVDSEDESDKTDMASSTELHRGAGGAMQASSVRASQPRTDPAPQTSHTVSEPTPIVVPSQDNFTFQSSHPWPQQQQDASMNFANLSVSDSRSHDDNGGAAGATARSARTRQQRSGGRQSGQLGRGAGSKRRINYEEIFDIGSLTDKNVFGGSGNGGGSGGFGGGKRPRHT